MKSKDINHTKSVIREASRTGTKYSLLDERTPTSSVLIPLPQVDQLASIDHHETQATEYKAAQPSSPAAEVDTLDLDTKSLPAADRSSAPLGPTSFLHIPLRDL